MYGNSAEESVDGEKHITEKFRKELTKANLKKTAGKSILNGNLYSVLPPKHTFKFDIDFTTPFLLIMMLRGLSP